MAEDPGANLPQGPGRLNQMVQAFYLRMKAGTKPRSLRFRPRSRYRSSSGDDPKAAKCAARILMAGWASCA